MSDKSEHAERYDFERFTLDPERGALQGPGGEIRLRPKSYELLLYLVRHPGRLVGREELLNAVWGHLAVTDDSVTQCLVEIRRVLGDDSRRMVRTVPRRGYVFDVPVTPLSSPTSLPEPSPANIGNQPAAAAAAAAAAPGGRSSFPPITALALVLFALLLAWWGFGQRDAGAPGRPAIAVPTMPNSIAVLPFVDMSAERDQEYFGDGIAEEILNLLAQVKELKVIARTSSFSFKGQQADIKRIAAQLGVAHVLEGSIRKSGNRVRVTAQLVDTRDSAHLWSHAYDRELDEIFTVQTEIAGSVARVLRATLLDTPSRAVPDVRAYEHFLRGRALFHRRAPGNLERARQHYETAVEFDPDYAPAWAALAGTYIVEVGDGDVDAETGLEKARHAAERALALDPNLPEAHLRAAAAYGLSGAEERARHHFRIAESLDPDNPLLLGNLGGGALARGDLAAAIEFKRRAVEVDPLSIVNRVNFGTVLRAAGRLDEARAHYSAAREMAPDRFEEIDVYLAKILILEGRHQEALESLQTSGDESDQREAALAMALHGLGREAESQAAIAGLAARTTYSAAARLAEIHAYRGELDAAWHWLDESRVRIRTEVAGAHWRWLQLTCSSAFLRPLHADPRWAVLFPVDQ